MRVLTAYYSVEFLADDVAEATNVELLVMFSSPEFDTFLEFRCILSIHGFGSAGRHLTVDVSSCLPHTQNTQGINTNRILFCVPVCQYIYIYISYLSLD